MHSHPKRLRAVYLVVAMVLMMAACGDDDSSASTPNDQPVGTDTRLGRHGSAETRRGATESSDSGFTGPTGDQPVVDDGSGPIELEPQVTEGQPELGRPAEVVPAVRRQLDDNAIDGRGGEMLESIEPLDQAPVAGQAIGIRDGRTRNEAGELNRLDEAAALACGDVERALTALDGGDWDEAEDLLASAADRAARSTVDDIEAWSTTLADTVKGDTGAGGSPAALLGFLSACTHGGYEL